MDKVRKEAYQIVYKVMKNRLRSEVLLDKASAKLTNNKDRALLYHLVKGILKMLDNLEYITEQLCDTTKYSKTDIKIKLLLYLGIFQLKYCDHIPDHHTINETVELSKTLYGQTVADYVNAVLRKFQRNSAADSQPNDEKNKVLISGIVYPADFTERLAKQYSFPVDLINEWLKLWSEEEVEKLCVYYNDPAKLSIRINRMATDKKRMMKYFQRKNIVMQEVDLSNNVLVTSSVYETLNDVSFNEGYFSVQDPSAAMIVELLKPETDENILDLFAGPGGKCTYISELLENTGEVIAVDRYPQKVKKIKQALHRLQITNTITVVEDALKYAPRAPAYDKVILDVPCSGWGVLQKKPELRWQKNQDMKSLLKLQEHSLSIGSLFVKAGGFLVYSTCTMNPRENEVQVEKFLQANKGFKMVDAAKHIPKRYTKNGYLSTLPQRDHVDGAFAAKLQKL